jgi:fluoroacetyl-CoA thioesterase
MSESLRIGIENKRVTEVTANNTATAYGSGTVDVFATPALVALMEQTAMESVDRYLPEGKITVGTEVHVSHLRATPLGKQITCKSILVSINEKQLCFEVEASDDKGVIGRGTHTRYIVDKQRFINKL